MSDEIVPYSPDLPAVPDHGGAVSIPDYSNVPAQVRDAFTPSPYGTSDHAPAPYQPGPGATGSKAFGVPLPAGITPASALGGLEDLGNAFRIYARRNNIERNATETAIAWVMGNALRPVPRHVERRHGYDLGGVPVDGALELFANAMHEAGVSHADFTGMRKFYGNLARQAPVQPSAGRYGGTAVSDADYDRAVERSEADAEACATALKIRWGDEYVSRLRTVKQHVASLPAAQRDMLETSITADGVAALNQPSLIEQLYLQAVGGQPANLQAEIAEIESVLRNQPTKYWKSANMQERYRYLLSLRDGN